jgi:hypothetical protein
LCVCLYLGNRVVLFPKERAVLQVECHGIVFQVNYKKRQGTSVNWIHLSQNEDFMAGCCEHCIELSDSIKGAELVE